MRVDLAVVRGKYDREINRLTSQRSMLESRGVFLLQSSTFPKVDFFIAPRHPLRMALPSGVSPAGIAAPPGAVLLAELPSLSARAFRARFDLTDFDLQAPSLEFLDAWSEEPLAYDTMFRALEYEPQRKQHAVLLQDHPHTHRPFLCLRGIREYHEHPQHSGDDWLLYRGNTNLFSIVMSVWRVTVDLVHVHLLPTASGPQIHWVADEKV